MHDEEAKSELLTWVSNLKDDDIIKELLHIKRQHETTGDKEITNKKVRQFGSGRHLIKYVADDFNDPIDFGS